MDSRGSIRLAAGISSRPLALAPLLKAGVITRSASCRLLRSAVLSVLDDQCMVSLSGGEDSANAFAETGLCDVPDSRAISAPSEAIRWKRVPLRVCNFSFKAEVGFLRMSFWDSNSRITGKSIPFYPAPSRQEGSLDPGAVTSRVYGRIRGYIIAHCEKRSVRGPLPRNLPREPWAWAQSARAWSSQLHRARE